MTASRRGDRGPHLGTPTRRDPRPGAPSSGTGHLLPGGLSPLGGGGGGRGDSRKTSGRAGELRPPPEAGARLGP